MRLRLLLVMIAIAALTAGSIKLYNVYSEHRAAELLLQRNAALARAVKLPDPAPQPAGEAIEVKRDHTASQILLERGLSANEAQAVIDAAKPYYDLSRISVGRKLYIQLDQSGKSLTRLVYEPDDERTLVVERTADGFAARLDRLELEVLVQPYVFKVENSLWWDARASGLDNRTTGNLIEIYEYDIDFFLEQQQGDTYVVLLEHKYDHGRLHKFGQILSAVAIVHNEPHTAFWFGDDQGKGAWYNAKGDGLRRAFLKAPLDYRRISSGYTMRRRHPILGRVRPHQGVDYAAPRGTPVRAVANGTVVFAGNKGGFGRFVELKHINNYNTCYAHLSKFGSGIRSGVRVKQGQIIGYVGSSGLSTGPHLDFRLKKNGHYINPLTEKLPTSEPLAAAQLPQFKELVERRRVQMELDQAWSPSEQALAEAARRSAAANGQEEAEAPEQQGEPAAAPAGQSDEGQGLPTSAFDSGDQGAGQ